MAFVVYRDGHKGTISAQKALAVWQVIAGEKTAQNESQQAYVDSIERLFLAWPEAPDSYRQRYPRKYDAPGDDTAVVVQGTAVKHWSDV